MADLHGVASWPGVVSVESCTYTCSQGIYPGTAILQCAPQASPPALVGDLVITDGDGAVVVPGCKVDQLRTVQDDSGFGWTLAVQDRRWKWRECGLLSGEYNLRDPHGYLLPWTARTPTQLAKLCLDAMGEVDFTVLMPDDFFPEVRWDAGTNPASALQQLAEDHGCVVCYEPLSDSVLVVPKGVGDALPAGSVAMAGPTFQALPRPDSIFLVGAPVRHQTRMRCEAVGEDWDGTILPINFLSYAPLARPAAVQVDQVIPQVVNANDQYVLTINGTEVVYTTTTNSLATLCNSLASAVNGDLHLLTVVAASTDGTAVTLTGVKPGRAYPVQLEVTPGTTVPPGWATLKRTQEAADAGDPWENCRGPSWAGVRATDRLSRIQAMELAERSVWKWYRVLGTNEDGSGPLDVPGYGPIRSIFQLLLEPTRVDQITPNIPREIVVPQERIILQNLYYNGWSRDQPAACFGIYFAFQFGNENSQAALANTLPGSQILVPFQVDAQSYTVRFAEPVYAKTDGNGLQPAVVFLETAVQIRDPDTNAVVRYERAYTFPGPAYGTGPKVIRKDDVQQNYAGVYDPLTNRLVTTRVDIPDADARADYYLLGEAAQWNNPQAAEVLYNGILPIAVDGAVQQVTWSVGPDGASTHASRNSEHNVFVPTLPERRRLDHLAPANVETREARLREAQANRPLYLPILR